jgi:hypothetical protein
MPFVRNFPEMDEGDTQTIGIDFVDEIPSGVTISGSPICVIEVSKGTDPDKDSRITEGPVVQTASTTTGGSGVENMAILVTISNPPSTVDEYMVQLKCLLSNGNTADGWGHLPIKHPK